MNWDEFDFDKSIHSFEFTRKAEFEIYNHLDYKDFDTRDSEIIFEYLLKQMRVVLFGDQLKRYVFSASKAEGEYTSLTEEQYIDIINNAIRAHNTPIPKSTKQETRRILNIYSVKRDTIFAYGLGLGMSDVDVSDFLTKVILEHDFDFCDPKEVIYWFCFHFKHRYALVKEMNQYYESLDASVPAILKKREEKKWNEIRKSPKEFLTDKKKLMKYLEYMKKYENRQEKEEVVYQEFFALYERARKTALGIMSEGDDFGKKEKEYTLDDIRPAEIETILYSSTPRNKQGNLVKMKDSRLSKLFQQKRLSRQRMTTILNKEKRADRFDLITLLFFIYSKDVEPDFPSERYQLFIKEMNEILKRCEMYELYPVNPYETFILMCILSEEPLTVFTDVFELSFGDEDKLI